MTELYSETVPQIVESHAGRLTINYNVRELTNEEVLTLWDSLQDESQEYIQINDAFIRNHRYAYYSLRVGVSDWTRDGIVNAIIRDKYRQDEMEAITNNMAAVTGVFFETLVSEGIVAATKYLLSSINDENSERFKEMQEWRAMAKQVASEIIKPN